MDTLADLGLVAGLALLQAMHESPELRTKVAQWASIIKVRPFIASAFVRSPTVICRHVGTDYILCLAGAVRGPQRPGHPYTAGTDEVGILGERCAALSRSLFDMC